MALTDYYELLGGARAAPRPTRSSGPTAAWPASCTPTPTRRPRGRGTGSRRSAVAYEILSDPERRQRYDRYGAEGDGRRRRRPVRRRRRPRRPLRRVLRRWQPVRRRRRAAPVRPRAPTSRWSSTLAFEEAVFGTQAPVTRAHRGRRATTARRTRRRAGHLRRRRARSAAAPARCGGSASRSSARWSRPRRAPAAAALGTVVDDRRARACHGEGRRIEERTYTVDVPAGVDDGSHPAAHRPRRGRAPRRRRRRPLRAPAGAAPRPLRRATATTSSTSCTSRWPRPRSAPTSTFETLDGAEDLVVARGTQTGECSAPAGPGRARTSRAGAGATCSCRSVVDTPTDLTDERGGRCCASSPSCGARRSRRPTTGLLRQDPLRVQVDRSRRRSAPRRARRPARLRRRPRRSPSCADDDRHHLARVLRAARRRRRSRCPTASARWRPCRFGDDARAGRATIVVDAGADAAAHRRRSRW